jgi:hypothetical protein
MLVIVPGQRCEKHPHSELICQACRGELGARAMHKKKAYWKARDQMMADAAQALYQERTHPPRRKLSPEE